MNEATPKTPTTHPHGSVILLDWLKVQTNDPHGCTVTYLGYPLPLSSGERRILLALLYAAADGGTPYVPMPQMQEAARAPDHVPCSAAQVSVLVGRINRKAFAIGGRKLIDGKSHRGFRLNPYM